MMTSKMYVTFKPLVEKFVGDTRGFYNDHVSDRMLTALLMWRLSESWLNSDATKSRGQSILEGDVNAAYDAACCIFEQVLEHGAQAGGNGHHRAQDFSAALESLRNCGIPETVKDYE